MGDQALPAAVLGVILYHLYLAAYRERLRMSFLAVFFIVFFVIVLVLGPIYGGEYLRGPRQPDPNRKRRQNVGAALGVVGGGASRSAPRSAGPSGGRRSTRRRSALRGADADRLEADGGVGLDRPLVARVRVDREAMMAALAANQRIAVRSASGPRPWPWKRPESEMSRPTERYSGSVSSVNPSQPASSPSVSIAQASPSIRRFSRSRSGSSDSPHQSATPGSRMMAASGSRSASAIGRRVTRSPWSAGSDIRRQTRARARPIRTPRPWSGSRPVGPPSRP